MPGPVGFFGGGGSIDTQPTVTTTWQNDDFGGAAHDFTATPTLSITPDTTGGAVTWTADDAAGASAFARTSAGIEITPNGSTDWFGGGKTAPSLEVLMSDLVSDWDGTKVSFVQAHVVVDAFTVDYQTMALALNGTSRTTNDFATMGRQRNSGSTSLIDTFSANNATETRVEDATVYDLFTWILRPNQAPMAVWGQWAGAWPDPRAWVGVCRDTKVSGLTTAAADIHAAVASYQPLAAAGAKVTLIGMRAGRLAL